VPERTVEQKRRMSSGVRTLVSRLSWITVSHVVTSVLRLLNNVVLARLLAPSLLGTMLIVSLFRTGVELFTDVGIGQNIVSNKKGHDPDFYDTAWTIQVFRGLVLGLICVLLAKPLAHSFGKAELSLILPFAALFCILAGFSSVSTFLVQKNIEVARFATFEMVLAALNIPIYWTLAVITPTIWALIIGSVASYAALTVSTYLLIPGIRHRFFIDLKSAREILVFGKWIFWSSMISFLAMNFDRLFFAKELSLTQLGIYGIARNLTEMITQLAVRYGNLLLFPMIAGMAAAPPEVRGRIRHGRRLVLAGAAVGLGGLVAGSDLIIHTLYDARYREAGIILPLLLVAAWLAILSTVNEYMLLGVSKPAMATFANAAKFVSYAVAAPIAFYYFGLVGAVLALSAGEAIKYVSLWLQSRSHHLGFGRDDAALSIMFLLSVAVFREALFGLGLSSNVQGLFPWIAAFGLKQ
jgi:O-antigen/teichoic acid export membrane protein